LSKYFSAKGSYTPSPILLVSGLYTILLCFNSAQKFLNISLCWLIPLFFCGLHAAKKKVYYYQIEQAD
jgi:hypothetical protein